MHYTEGHVDSLSNINHYAGNRRSIDSIIANVFTVLAIGNTRKTTLILKSRN